MQEFPRFSCSYFKKDQGMQSSQMWWVWLVFALSIILTGVLESFVIALLGFGGLIFSYWKVFGGHTSKAVFQVESRGFTIEILSASKEIEVGKHRFLWEELESFSFYSGENNSDDELLLRYFSGEKIKLSGEEMKLLNDYLKSNFPEKREKNTWNTPFT